MPGEVPLLTMCLPLSRYTNNHKISEIIINKINNISKKFLRNATARTNKKSPINWKFICTPKSQGGLGFRNLHILNKVFFLKLVWRLCVDNSFLWAKTIREKYFPNHTIWTAPLPKNYHSSSWKNIHKMIPKLQNSCQWIIGSGEKINLWKDKRLDNLCITHYVKNIHPSIENLRAADIIHKNNNSWNLTLIEHICPSFILEKIHAIHIPHPPDTSHIHPMRILLIGSTPNMGNFALKKRTFGCLIKANLYLIHHSHGTTFGSLGWAPE